MPEPEITRDKQSPAKLVLAIGLIVVFVAVVAVQIENYWGDGEATNKAQSDGSVIDRLETDLLQLPRLNRPLAVGEVADEKWTEVQLSECTKYDPFATPNGFNLKKEKPVQRNADGEALRREIEIAKKRAAQEQVISNLRDAGVNAVFKGPRQSTAIIGTRMVRVGEDFQGFRVLAIETDGIVIQRPAVR